MTLRRLILASTTIVGTALWATSCIVGIFPDQQMSLEKLHGLTPEEVISKLGTPRYDPRVPDPRYPQVHTWSPERESTAGPLQLEYNDQRFLLCRWRGFGYMIGFENNHVSNVDVGAK
jgi:hypothetical protein